MLRVTLDNVSQKRTIRPLYAQTQATPWGCALDPDHDFGQDILPGMVMTHKGQEVAALVTSDSEEVWGLSGLFVAPKLGIDEVRPTGTNNFAVWVGDEQSVFEVLAPAFAESATWTAPEDGAKTPLRVTLTGHSDGPGKLTPEAAGVNVSSKVAAHLINVVGDNKIIVSLEKA